MDDVKEIENLKWSNAENENFYHEVSGDDLIKFAESSGIDRADDVKAIFPYLKSANSILEVNAGYGRVISALLSLGFEGKVSAIERNDLFVSLMKMSLPAAVTIIHDDLLSYNFVDKYDAILFLWSCLTEFNRDEQSCLFQKMTNSLTEGGMLAVDLISEYCLPKHVSTHASRHITVKKNNAIDNFYLPSFDELLCWAKKAGLSLKHTLEYQVANDLNRVCYIFSR